MDTGSDFQKLVQIAKMYYAENMTQDAIAKELGISRSAVSILLTEAKNSGIIQIQIKDPWSNNEELSGQMEARFGLEKCIVVPTGVQKERLLLKIVAGQAARFASEQIRSHSSVGIAWGSACYEFMNAFPEDTELCDIGVVPLIGGSPLVSMEFQLNETVRTFAEKLRGTPMFIYTPGMVESLQDKERFLESLYMRSILEQWGTLDFAVIGIGRPPESYERSQSAHSAGNTLDEIVKFPDMAIGDLCARWFNIRGEILECSHNSRLIGIDEDGLRHTKRVLAIATGNYKVFSIIGALNTGLIHYFVTDEGTAKQVLAVLNEGVLQARGDKSF